MASASAEYLPLQEPRIANILFATDFSPCSLKALPYACALANQNRATLHLINVMTPSPLVETARTANAHKEREADSRRELAKLSETPELTGIRYECSVHRGTVWEVLCRLVEEQGIDLVVMATHGRRGVRQFVLGSVTEEVFRRVRCPVLTIGPGAGEGPATERFRTIIAALDLSPESHKVLEYARTFSILNGSALEVLHVIQDSSAIETDDPNYLDNAVAFSRQQLSRLLPRDVSRTEVSIKIGSPAEVILQTAEDRGADLIVIGARRGIRLAARTPWAVAHEVVCGSSCPVLTVAH